MLSASCTAHRRGGLNHTPDAVREKVPQNSRQQLREFDSNDRGKNRTHIEWLDLGSYLIR